MSAADPVDQKTGGLPSQLFDGDMNRGEHGIHKMCIRDSYEARQFAPAPEETGELILDGKKVPFGTRLLFACPEMEELTVAAEICEDLWVPEPPSIHHALAGATVLVNLSASDEVTGKDRYRRNLVAGQSARLVCAYLYATAGEGESTTDLVFGGQNLIGENGQILAEEMCIRDRAMDEVIGQEYRLPEAYRIQGIASLQLGDYPEAIRCV